MTPPRMDYGKAHPKALIVILDGDVTELGAEALLADIEREFEDDVTMVEHFTTIRARQLIADLEDAHEGDASA